jgi:hypothetical protein
MDHSFLEKCQMFFFQYIPLIIVSLFALILALIPSKLQPSLIFRFMGFFLMVFSLFKWVDIKGYVEAFKEYDLVSKLFKPYLFLYPALEMLIGYFFTINFLVFFCNIAIIVLMLINGVSIGHAIVKKRKLYCACLGTTIKLPLSVVSLFETIVMLLMAVLML